MSIHGSPVIHFPATELADLKSRLASGHTISSVHDTGKHKSGDILMSSLGMLRVVGVKPVAPHELTAHSGAVKAHVAGERGDMLELKKLGEAAVTNTPALDLLQAKTAAILHPDMFLEANQGAPSNLTTSRQLIEHGQALRQGRAAAEALAGNQGYGYMHDQHAPAALQTMAAPYHAAVPAYNAAMAANPAQRALLMRGIHG